MNTKAIIYNKVKNAGVKAFLLLLAPCSLLLSSCDDKLDIVPKGMTTLENVDDLESLLNQEYMINVSPASDLGIICNESYGSFLNVAEVMAQSNTLNYAYTTYDESIDRAALATDDARYQNCYKYINYMNVVISKMDDATGNSANKARYIAEARMVRAYLHWLLVNIYAKQYDDATAEDEGGIPYVVNTDVSEEKTKLSLAETYRRILEDCSDEVIAQLPQKNTNVERVDQAFGNAVRAKVLMQMKHYAEALPYAQASLRLNNTIEDRSAIVESMTWSLPQTAENNLLYIGAGTRVSPTFTTIMPETYALFEEGDYVAAECLIRTGKIQEGLQMVDRVRAKRVENYEPFAQGNPSEQEAMAMMQRAKWVECIASYENFFDCKRWNTEANYKRTITRNLGSYGTFTL